MPGARGYKKIRYTCAFVPVFHKTILPLRYAAASPPFFAVGVRNYTGIIFNETAASNEVKATRAAFSDVQLTTSGVFSGSPLKAAWNRIVSVFPF